MIRNDYAEVNGIRLHYASAGAGKLILFVHGFPEFWYAWRKQLEEFGRDHLAVAPDLRGYNLSAKPKDVRQYEMQHLVADLRALAQNLTPEKFVLVGHDWGAVVAWAYAMAHPEDLEKLAVINGPHPAIFRRELRENEAQRRASRYMLFFRSRVAEPALSAFRYAALVKTVLSQGLKQGYFNKEDQAAYLQAWSQPGALTGGLNYYRAAQLGPARGGKDASLEAMAARLPSPMVHVPTLVIWGEQDRYLLPGCLEGLEQYVPDLTLRRVPEATHWIVHEQPTRVNQFIREFLGKQV
ncbi:MAG TPA: alpha/beta hydrolase [Anaerolineales bacterium]